MRLIKMTSSQKVPDRWYAEFENGERLRVNTALIADFSLFSGREMDADEFDALKNSTEREGAKARALNILGTRSMSCAEIKERLLSKGESEVCAQETVGWLEKNGFVNDSEYSKMLARHYAAKGYGRAKIKDELYRRGIARDMWDEALSAVPEQDGTIDALIEKKLCGGKPDRAEAAKITAYLRRRGFSWEEIRSALERYGARTEENYE